MRCLREEEEQRELERQFIAQLERKRQERLNVEQMRNQRARALEELKRQEMMRTPAKANCMNVDSCEGFSFSHHSWCRYHNTQDSI